jgi:prepilin-type N-terminal cleavage/methylation domain-containing protein
MNTQRNGGFTLVEVLAAVLLLSIGLLAVLTANSAARQTQQCAVRLSIGRLAAQSAIERLRSNINYTLPSTTVAGLPSGNNISICVSSVSGSRSDTKLTYASVSVSWPEGNGTQKVFYETYISPK